jgi:hypothetical protein
MKKYSILLLLMIFSCVGFAQVEPAPENQSRLKEANPIITESDFEGTYQVILSDKRMVEPEITKSTLLLIKKKREQNQTIFITVDQYTKIKVVSYKTINSKGFTPLKKYRYEE